MSGKIPASLVVLLVCVVLTIGLAVGASAQVSVREQDVDGDGATDIVIDNGVLEVTINPAAGGRILDLKFNDGPNIAHKRWGIASDHPGVLGVWAGWDLYRNSQYSYEVIKSSGEEAIVKVVASNDDLLHKVEKTFTISAGANKIEVALDIQNVTRKSYKDNGTAFLSFIPIEKGGKSPVVFLPLKDMPEYDDGLPVPLAAEQEGWFIYDRATEMEDNWLMVYDPNRDITVKLVGTDPVPTKYASGVAVGNYVSLETHYYMDWPSKASKHFEYELSFHKGIQHPAIEQALAGQEEEQPAQAAGEEEYFFPPGAEQAGGIEDMILIYCGWYDPPAIGTWTEEDALRYVAYVDQEGNIKDWFFDTYLFLGLESKAGRAFDSSERAEPAKKEDWQWFMDWLFAPGRQLEAFNRAVATAKAELDDWDYKGKVVIALPNPNPEDENFGDVDGDGVSENFAATDDRSWEEAHRDRMEAVRWYVDSILRRWEEANFTNLELIGFYWLAEEVDYTVRSEVPTIQATSELVHEKGYKFYWIPWFRAPGFRDWKELGFDMIIMQPNYFFHENVPEERFAETVKLAKKHHMGIEIEGESRFLYEGGDNWRRRYYKYLESGVEFGFMKNAAKAYYQGAKALLRASYSRNPEVRRLYDDTYRFVKGTFTP